MVLTDECKKNDPEKPKTAVNFVKLKLNRKPVFWKT